MANEIVTRLTCDEFVGGAGASPYGGVGRDGSNVPYGLCVGIGMVGGKTNSIYAGFRVPNSAALATGLTFEIALAADNAPGNIDLVNQAMKFGVTVGPITSGTSTFDESSTGALASSTEATGTITMTSVAPVVYTLSIAVPIASMNGLAAGGHAMLRIRRLGGAAPDIGRNRALISWVDIRNT